jgi:flagellar basal body-associated protein FliL
MTEDYGPTLESPLPPLEEEPKKNNTTLWIIIIVVVLVLCCCCVVFGGAFAWLWFNGDSLLQDLGVQQLLYLIA